MLSLGMNVNERQLASVRQATAQLSSVFGDCKVLLYSSRPSSPHVSFAGGLGFGVADMQAGEEVGIELSAVLLRQLIAVFVIVIVVI